ncbi:MAG: hypothetical protein J5891_06005 [Spirochaetales bacterium]|nr:hypothetical protein [Spirochaetales bacterium]
MKTKKGSWRLFGLFVAIMLCFAFLSNMISTNFFRVTHTKVSLDVRGADLAFEIWRPTGVTPDQKLPAIMISHGGSEMLSCTSLYAWEFARRGFVVINENMNGAGMNGQPAVDEAGYTFGSYSRTSTAGHLDVLNYVRTITYVDKTRICVWGHSQGGGTQGAALRLDGTSLTVNDMCCNILHDDYGIEFTEEMVKQNADDIAKAKLNEYQLKEYYAKKEGAVEKYNQTVFFNRGGGGGTATVAGIRVRRDAQLNSMPSIGAHEDKGLPDPEHAKSYMSGFRLNADNGDSLVVGGIYYLPDNSLDGNTTSIYLGKIFEIDVRTNPLFMQAVKERCCRFYNIPQTIHNGWLWSYKCVSTTVEFVTQCCRYNCGELEDPNTVPISGRNCWLSYSTLVCTTAAFFSLMMVLCCLGSIIVKTEFFKPIENERIAARMPVKGPSIWIWVVATLIAGFAGEWACSQNDPGFSFCINTMTRILPWEPGQVKLWWSVIASSVVGVALYFLLGFITKKINKDKQADPVLANLKELNIKCGFRNFFKAILLAVILWVAAYLFAAFIDKFFETRFLHVDGSYELMQWWNFGRMFRYFLIILPFTLVMSTLNNMVKIDGVSEGADTAIRVFVLTLGMIFFMGIGFLVTYSSPGHAEIFHIHAMLATIFLIPAMNFLYVKMYKATGNVYVGGALVALFLAWRCAGYLCQRFMLYGNNEIAAFWGIPII